MAIVWRGHRDASAGTVDVTSLALPTGTQVGDVLVFVANAGAGTITVADTRLSKVADLDIVGTGADNATNAEVWMGYATTLDALDVTVTADFSGSAYQVVVGAIGNATYTAQRAQLSAPASEPWPVPIAPAAKASLAVIIGTHGVGSWSTNPIPNWTRTYIAGAYRHITIATADPGADSECSWDGSMIPTRQVVVRLNPLLVAPPCRLFPRGDGLGVGSGRRFPPPKSQQKSGRRFGYY